MPSANIIGFANKEDLYKTFVWKRNSNGPKIDLWETPSACNKSIWNSSFIAYYAIIASFFIKILWSTATNSFEISINMPMVYLFSMKPFVISSAISITACSVKRLAWKPNCWLNNTLCSAKCMERLFYISFPKIFWKAWETVRSVNS